jgi:hypothetical protein
MERLGLAPQCKLDKEFGIQLIKETKVTIQCRGNEKGLGFQGRLMIISVFPLLKGK